MNQFKNFLNDEMDDEAMEEFVENIIHQKFDHEKKQAWSQILKDKHGLERKKQPDQTARVFSIRRILSIAAAIALILGAFYFIDQTSLSTDQALAQSYVDELPIMADQLVARKGDFNEDETRIKANEAYINMDFDSAVGYWTEIVNNQTDTPYDLFYLGVSTLRANPSQPKKAINFLLEAQTNAPNLRHEINWVLSLAYVRSGQIEKARPILKSIVATQEYMSEPAANLLELLKTDTKVN
jgi:hypothetical protein